MPAASPEPDAAPPSSPRPCWRPQPRPSPLAPPAPGAGGGAVPAARPAGPGGLPHVHTAMPLQRCPAVPGMREHRRWQRRRTLGIALLACGPGWSRADRQGAVPALAGIVRDAARQENQWSPHGALMERPLNLQSAGQGPAGCSGSTRPGTGAAGQAGWAEDRRPPPGPAHGRCLRPRPRFWHPALRRTSGSPSRGQDLAPAACPAARDW